MALGNLKNYLYVKQNPDTFTAEIGDASTVICSYFTK